MSSAIAASSAATTTIVPTIRVLVPSTLGESDYAAYLRPFKNAIEVSFAHCASFTDRAADDVAALGSEFWGSVRHLVFRYTSVTDSAVEKIAAHCAQLHTLDLKHCRGITGAAVKAVAAKSNTDLLSLNLVNTSCGDDTLEVVGAHCGRLLYADFSWVSAGDTGLLAVARASSSSLIKLGVPTRCTDAGLASATSTLTGLTSLSIVRCGISDDGLRAAIEPLAMLEKLQLAKLELITDTGLTAIAPLMPKLKDVSLRTLGMLVSERGVCQVLRHCKRTLEHVSLCCNLRLTDLTLDCIGFHLRKLKTLELNKLHGITGETLLEVASRVPTLEHVEVEGCEKIDLHQVYSLTFQIDANRQRRSRSPSGDESEGEREGERSQKRRRDSDAEEETAPSA